MKNLAFFLCLAACLMLAPKSFAYDTPPGLGPMDKKIIDTTAKSVETYTEMFAMKKLVFANVLKQGQIVVLQYMPEDLENLQEWTRMLEITVYGLSGDWKSDFEAEKGIIHGLETQYGRIGTLNKDENYLMNENKDMGMFIQYTVGKDADQMTAAGAFLRISDRAAAYIQMNARGRPLKKKESVAVQKLVNPLADALPKVKP